MWFFNQKQRVREVARKIIDGLRDGTLVPDPPLAPDPPLGVDPPESLQRDGMPKIVGSEVRRNTGPLAK
jgi:hypothetical protein